MPTYKLTYFNGMGRGEATRLLFALGGQKFEDERIEFADWPKLKPKTPLGSLPILNVDGKELSQSVAVARYVARQFGLYGKTDFEKAQGDMVVDCSTDAFDALTKVQFAQDDKAELLQKYKDENFEKQMGTFEKLLSDKGYFLGSSLSWADLQVFALIDAKFPGLELEVDSKAFPKLTKMMNNVRSNANIAEYLKNRPKTPF